MAGTLDALVAGLVSLFVWKTFLLLLLGIGVGFVVGILPGLGGSAALALMLPFTFTMQPFEAFAFLLGNAAVLGTTGDITSIVFGIPGEPHTAATILDGHAMARQGAAGRALGAALASSLVGACVGALALALAVPVVRPLVLLIGYAEFLMLSLLGITFVAILSGGSLTRGLIAAGVGLLLSTVGLDPQIGVDRYTFGQLFLWDGVGVVAVVLGLFAIPEIIDLGLAQGRAAPAAVGRLDGVMQGVRDTFRHWALVLRCSAIGAYIGIIPGMGASVGQWIAYAHARQSSRDPARFGRGAVEGVLGPGAANNSALGGALIPAVAFGVPSSAFMAVLMGAFVIQGLVPGPKMLVPERLGGHLALTFSFVWMIIVSNVITVGACFMFLEPLARITRVRGSLLLPIILWLIYLGAFAEKNAPEDMLVMLVAGALGWVMVQLDWPRPPLVIGLVLGGLIENNLFLATSSEGARWLGRPGVLLLAGIIVVGVVWTTVAARRSRAADSSAAGTAGEVAIARDASPEGARAAWMWDVVFVAVLLVVVGLALWAGRGWQWQTSLFPRVVAVPTLALAGVYLVRRIRDRVHHRRSAARVGDAVVSDPRQRRAVAATWFWIVVFFVSIGLLGFAAAIPVGSVAYLRLAGRERWATALLVAVISWAVFVALFGCFLHVPAPEGVLLRSLVPGGRLPFGC